MLDITHRIYHENLLLYHYPVIPDNLIANFFVIKFTWELNRFLSEMFKMTDLLAAQDKCTTQKHTCSNSDKNFDFSRSFAFCYAGMTIDSKKKHFQHQEHVR